MDVGLKSGKVRAIAQLDAVPPLAVSGKHPFSTCVGMSAFVLYLPREFTLTILQVSSYDPSSP